MPFGQMINQHLGRRKKEGGKKNAKKKRTQKPQRQQPFLCLSPLSLWLFMEALSVKTAFELLSSIIARDARRAWQLAGPQQSVWARLPWQAQWRALRRHCQGKARLASAQPAPDMTTAISQLQWTNTRILRSSRSLLARSRPRKPRPAPKQCSLCRNKATLKSLSFIS